MRIVRFFRWSSAPQRSLSERHGEPPLAFQPGHPVLECDAAIEAGVASAIDFAHPTSAQQVEPRSGRSSELELDAMLPFKFGAGEAHGGSGCSLSEVTKAKTHSPLWIP